MIFFTADLHFGHDKLVARRGFDSVEEMDETLIDNWNARITDADTVYIAGDMFVCPVRRIRAILDRLAGIKILAVGNHDRTWIRHRSLTSAFREIAPVVEYFGSRDTVVVTHYPMLDWYRRRHGAIQVYGHVHDACDAPYSRYLARMRGAYNAGVDVCGLAPVTLAELRARPRGL